ncbi:MAG: hypothetical protein M4579_003575 [Chaenotheca gracillima]|nr:MAG: hypothetical protein M4579_003575 [Chaenotheca gracillima]
MCIVRLRRLRPSEREEEEDIPRIAPRPVSSLGNIPTTAAPSRAPAPPQRLSSAPVIHTGGASRPTSSRSFRRSSSIHHQEPPARPRIHITQSSDIPRSSSHTPLPDGVAVIRTTVIEHYKDTSPRSSAHSQGHGHTRHYSVPDARPLPTVTKSYQYVESTSPTLSTPPHSPVDNFLRRTSSAQPSSPARRSGSVVRINSSTGNRNPRGSATSWTRQRSGSVHSTIANGVSNGVELDTNAPDGVRRPPARAARPSRDRVVVVDDLGRRREYYR